MNEQHTGDGVMSDDTNLITAEINRWFAEHDRTVAERAWEEGARWAAVEFGNDASADESRVGLVPSDNPYRKERGSTDV